jgi:site-specific DNA recombinase
MKTAAIYARVSPEQQKEENTIASQTAALVEFAREQGYSVPDEWVIEDEGFSGASLLRPGLERLRDLAAEGHIQAVLIHSPDRLSRKYAYQVLLTPVGSLRQPPKSYANLHFSFDFQRLFAISASVNLRSPTGSYGGFVRSMSGWKQGKSNEHHPRRPDQDRDQDH